VDGIFKGIAVGGVFNWCGNDFGGFMQLMSNGDEFVKSHRLVMPDLIRHPQGIVINEFLDSPE
jgi:hypothetical protein